METRVKATVVQKLDSAIHRINRYAMDKYYENQLHYPLDGDLSSGYIIHLLNNWGKNYRVWDFIS